MVDGAIQRGSYMAEREHQDRNRTRRSGKIPINLLDGASYPNKEMVGGSNSPGRRVETTPGAAKGFRSRNLKAKLDQWWLFGIALCFCFLEVQVGFVIKGFDCVACHAQQLVKLTVRATPTKLACAIVGKRAI